MNIKMFGKIEENAFIIIMMSLMISTKIGLYLILLKLGTMTDQFSTLQVILYVSLVVISVLLTKPVIKFSLLMVKNLINNLIKT